MNVSSQARSQSSTKRALSPVDTDSGNPSKRPKRSTVTGGAQLEAQPHSLPRDDMDKNVENSEKQLKSVYDKLLDAENQYEQARDNQKMAEERLKQGQEQCKGFSMRAHRDLSSIDKKLDVIAVKLTLDRAREPLPSCLILRSY